MRSELYIVFGWAAFFSHLVNIFHCRAELLTGIGFICLIYNLKTVISGVGSILSEMLNYEYF